MEKKDNIAGYFSLSINSGEQANSIYIYQNIHSGYQALNLVTDSFAIYTSLFCHQNDSWTLLNPRRVGGG